MTLDSEIPFVPKSAPAKLLPVFSGGYDEKCRGSFFLSETDRCEEITSDSKWAYQLKIFWFPEADPSRSLSPWSSIQHKVKVFLLSFENFMPDYLGKCACVQFWEPITTKDGRRILSVSKQPFAVRQFLKGLCRYRYYCEELCRIGNRTEVENDFGPVGRAFSRGSVEFSPHIDLYSTKEFPLKYHAKHCGVAGYLALPIFEAGKAYDPGHQPPCVGVLEFISFTQNVLSSFDTGICMKKLKEAGLAFRYPSHSEALTQIRPYFNFPSRKGKPEEISAVLDTVRKQFSLPLIQVWLPCICYGSEVYVTCDPNGDSFSKITHLVCGIQCVKRDEKRSNSLSSYGACDSEVYFVESGESWVGRAHSLQKIRFVKDARQYNIANYPLISLCNSSDLKGCFAVPLQLVNPKLPPLVLELFLPTHLCLDGNRGDIINPILSMVARELSKYYVNFGLTQEFVQLQEHQPLDATGIRQLQVPTEENKRAHIATGQHQEHQLLDATGIEQPQVPTEENKRADIAPCQHQEHQPLDATGTQQLQVSTEENKSAEITPCHKPLGDGYHSYDRRKTPAREKPWLTYVKRKNKSSRSGLLAPNSVPCLEPLVGQSTLKQSIETKERQVLAEESMRPYTVPCHEPLVGQSTVNQCIEIKERQEEIIRADASIPRIPSTLGKGKNTEPENGEVDHGISIPSVEVVQSTLSTEENMRPYTVPCHEPLVRQSTIKYKRGRPRKIIKGHHVQQTLELPNSSDDADQQSKKRYRPSDNSKDKEEAAAVSIPNIAEISGATDGRVASIGVGKNVIDNGPSIASTTGEDKNTRPEHDKVNQGASIPFVAVGQSTLKQTIKMKKQLVSTEENIRPDSVPCHEPLVRQSTMKYKRGRPHKIISGHHVQQTPELPNNSDDADQQSKKRCRPSDTSKEKEEAAAVSIPNMAEISGATDGRVASIGLGNNVIDNGSSTASTTGEDKNAKPEHDKVNQGTSIPFAAAGQSTLKLTIKMKKRLVSSEENIRPDAVPCYEPLVGQTAIKRKGGRPRKNINVHHAQQTPDLPNNSNDADQSKKRYHPSDYSKEKHAEAAVSIPILSEIPVAADGRIASIGHRNSWFDRGPSFSTGKGKKTVDHGTSIPTDGNSRNKAREINEVVHNSSTIVKAATVSIPIPVENPVASEGRVESTNVVARGLSISSTAGEGKNTDHGTSIRIHGKGRSNVTENNEVDQNCSMIVKATTVSIPTLVEIPVGTDGRVASTGHGDYVVDDGPSIFPAPSTTRIGKNTNLEIPTNVNGRNNVPVNDEVDHNCSLIVKARFKDDNVKFPFSSSLGIEGLRRELLRRFELEVGRFKIKYPEAGDWFLLTCSEDLSFHMRTLASAGKTIMELLISAK